MRAVLAAVCLVGLWAVPAGVSAQEGGAEAAPADTVYHMVLRDGSSFYGRIESQTADRVVFVTTGGARLEVERSQIRSLEPVDGRLQDGEVWPRDPNGTRLFFGPTGRSLRSGEGYIGLFELFFSFGAYGVGDRLVLAGGTPVIPGGGLGELIYLAPKLRVLSTGDADVSVGVLSFLVTEFIDEGSFGVAYGVGTVGDRDNAVTVGAGWPFVIARGESEVVDEPIWLIGGEVRSSRIVKLITENYVVLGEFALVSGGVRLLGERFSADIGMGGVLGLSDAEGGCCLPVLSASYSF